MNDKKIGQQWTAIAILCAAAALATFYLAPGKETLLVLLLPFDYLGKGLRMLSLHSQVGNALAVILYTVLCLLPLCRFFYQVKKKRSRPWDFLLVALTSYSFYMLYQLINPALLANHFSNYMSADAVMLPAIKFALCCVFYSLLIAYLILDQASRLSSLKPEHGENRAFLLLGLEQILYLSGILYTIMIGYFRVFILLKECSPYLLTEQSSEFMMSDALPGMVQSSDDLLFVLLQFILEILPVFATLLLLLAGIRLLEALRLSPFEQQPILAADRLFHASQMTVVATVSCNLIWNLTQFFFGAQLQNLQFQLEISLLPLILSFCAMLLSKGFRDVNALHEDNEMII